MAGKKRSTATRTTKPAKKETPTTFKVFEVNEFGLRMDKDRVIGDEWPKPFEYFVNDEGLWREQKGDRSSYLVCELNPPMEQIDFSICPIGRMRGMYVGPPEIMTQIQQLYEQLIDITIKLDDLLKS